MELANHYRVEPYAPEIIMGIESSCDETSVAILRNGREILANLVSSQIPLHEKYGGVVPEVACRAHMEVINPIITEALEKADLGFSDLNAVAVTYGPGLVGAVLLGVAAAKTLAGCLDIPLIGVNHLEGHIASSLLATPDVQFPLICLLVSGGHTMIVKVDQPGDYEVLGTTRDDAAGEAFDKVSKALGLGYPGGPKIQALALKGNKETVKFSRPMLNKGYEFSFSGLKTAVLTHLESPDRASNEDICASFQEAVVDTLVTKTMRAVKAYKAKSVAVGGGVSANARLRVALEEAARKAGILMCRPDLSLCTDNAVMIASAGYELARLGWRSPLTLDAKPNLPLVKRI